MTSKQISPEISQFIHERIQSVEQLDVLFLLARDPSRLWTAEQVASELRSTPTSIRRWLDNLRTQKLLIQNEPFSFVFAPEDPALVTLIDLLRDIYPQQRVRIIEMIFNKPAFRLESFANAFRWREDDKDG